MTDSTTDDIAAVMRHLAIPKAHIVGLSQGAAAALHFGIRYSGMCSALVITSGGSGSYAPRRDAWRAEMLAAADRILKDGLEPVARGIAESPARIPLRRKNPLEWEEALQRFYRAFAAGAGAHAQELSG